MNLAVPLPLQVIHQLGYILTIPSGPMSFAHRNIGTNPVSAWHLVVNKAMMKHIQTVVKQKHNCWSKSSAWRWQQLVCYSGVNAFLLYAHGKLGHSKLCADDLWGKNWGPPVYRETMSHNHFHEIMRYIRFNVWSSRAECLASNRFAFASETRYKLIENY